MGRKGSVEMTYMQEPRGDRVVSDKEDHYLVVSTDSHAGPVMETQLRHYCPAKYLDDFDAFVYSVYEHEREQKALLHPEKRKSMGGIAYEEDPSLSDEARRYFARVRACEGLVDPHARLRDMDEQGVAVDVIFAGGENVQELPFVGFGADAGNPAYERELRMVGEHIWNEWLVDFVGAAPERLVGVMQIPIFDVPKAIEEMRWGVERGLRGVNFPAPRRDFPVYFDECYEPFWSAVEELDVPLLTHVGGGEPPLGWPGAFPGLCMMYAELDWLSRRGLWQMIFGGVFERHPRLRLVFTEQRVTWVPPTLADLDAIWLNDMVSDVQDRVPKRPSEYWATNCFVAGSFLARFELDQRDAVGVENLMWGSDYPHVEGTWPTTRLSLRNTFAGVPEADARAVLGQNAVRVYNLDVHALAPTVERIGPTTGEIARPLDPDEYPSLRRGAFRELGVIA
jgi:predicted TIM-barrel fold metal-dependent hydrolase